jgi:hypothetical protein
MYSNLVPFESILESIKDETGIKNLSNLYPKIRRLIVRAEKDIGYGGSVILKRMKYSVAKGSIIFSNGIYKLRLPEDIINIESVGMCKEGICPGDYTIQGNYMFFCEGKNITEFSLIYYTMLFDGNGNPAITENHAEAVTAAVSYWLYKQRRFRDKGSAQHFQYLENYYHDRIAEARGMDIMPNTPEEWSQAASILKMSSSEIFFLSETEKCFCDIDLTENPNDMVTETSDNPIYSFQFDNISDGIAQAGIIDQDWLDANAVLHSEANLLNGKFVSFNTLGRIGFAIKTDTADQYVITDVLGNVLDEETFDKTYDAVGGFDIYISKQYYTQQSIYFKFKTV